MQRLRSPTKSSPVHRPSRSASVPTVQTSHSGGDPASREVTSSSSNGLREAWTAAHNDQHQEHRAERYLNKIAKVQSAFTPSEGQLAVVKALATPAKELMGQPLISEAIHKGVDSFMDAVPPLVKALDEIARIHPFIAVAVLAFKAVYTLEKKRRENDKRVLALYVEMKDMMGVLVQLGNVSDPKRVAPDGSTIEGRMQKLCEAAAEDIKSCANVCDTYLKKKILVKFFVGSVWEGRLVEFVGVFADRRKEFEFALCIHTAVGVDAANLALNTLGEQNAEISQKVDVLLRAFQEFATPEHKKSTTVVGEMGKGSILQMNRVMEELAEESTLTPCMDMENRYDEDCPADIAELRREVEGDPDDAIKRNANLFNGKFDILTREVMVEVARAIDQGMQAGSRVQVVDPDIQSIWKDMGWRGSVKARRFIMALKDHFTAMAVGSSGSLTSPDSWAMKYINIGRVRRILEAFDDDTSGFVTVSEVNNLTQLKPADWSLPHWIAYWAIGCLHTLTFNIEEIFDAMIHLAYKVLPENLKVVDRYIQSVWKTVTVFVQSIKREEGTEMLRSRFELHVTSEEARLRQNLESMKYRIDTSDTYQVVGGDGRLETTLFPMFYLILKRDLEKISLGQKHALSDRELRESIATIYTIVGVASDRINNLRSIFEQQDLRAKDQFETFAAGLYNICSVHGIFFDGDRLRELPDPIPCKKEVIPNPDLIPLSVLNYPVGKRHGVDFSAYDRLEPGRQSIKESHPMLGTYYGFIYHGGRPLNAMMKLTLNEGEGDRTFVASGTHFRGSIREKYTVFGRWDHRSRGGKIPVRLQIIYGAALHSTVLEGVYDPGENSLRGITATPTGGEFVLKRDPDFVRFYPAPSAINARERWRFCITVVLDYVRQQAWSSRRILRRIKDGKRYMELALKKSCGRDLIEDEMEEFLALLPGLYEADARFYASLIRINLSKIPVFPTIACDNCGSALVGSRVVCMDCRNDSTVDLCSEPECVNSTVTFEAADGKPHLPNHGMFKIYRTIFDRDMTRVENAAKDALESARDILLQLKEEKAVPGCVHCRTAVSVPCWCCVECATGEFICDHCEHRQLAFDMTHTKMHTMVRVSEKVAKERSTEERLQFLEDELVRISQSLAKVGQSLAKLVEKGSHGAQS